jgi:hypothetical protein
VDIFKFINPNAPTRMEQGKIINRINSKMWIERYREAGEFKLTATVGSGVGRELPIGTFISHVDTNTIMIVENHEIREDRNTEAEITITGRGLETFLENRIVGSNKTFPTSGTLTDYAIASAPVWQQALTMARDHTSASTLIDDNNAFPYLTYFLMGSTPSSSPSVDRTFRRGDLYKTLIDLLAIDDLGIKVVRPGPGSPLTGSPNTVIGIYQGQAKTSVIFSFARGAIESADYLWSNKKFKNAALVTSKWAEVVVLPSEVEYERRMMFVDASYVDDQYSTAPTGSLLTSIYATLQSIGTSAIDAQRDISLVKPQLAKNAIKPLYRTDFDIGDIVYVGGDYREVSLMRVIEYVELEDETGQDEYPTFDDYSH